MRVIVTGAAGVLGRHVAAATLARGHDVRGIDAAPQPNGGWERVTADLCDLRQAVELFHGADAIIHCAAIPRPVGHAPAEVYRVNMATVFSATEAARLCKVGLFLYASSFSVLGYPFAERLPVPRYLPIDEDHPVGPRDIYGTTKWLGEELVEAMVQQGAFRAVSLRMPWIQTPESFGRDIKPRRETADAAADLWSYLDARDAGDAFAQALSWTGAGHLRCYLSAGDSYSDRPTKDLIRTGFGDGIPLRRDLPDHAALIDCTRARRELGFVPTHSWLDYDARDEAQG